MKKAPLQNSLKAGSFNIIIINYDYFASGGLCDGVSNAN